MKFPEDDGGKRAHFKRVCKVVKYNILKEQNTDERGKKHWKHKPYQCDMGGNKNG